MGTRCLTVFKENINGPEIAVLYRQYDGYPAEHGRQLQEACAEVDHNGIGCAAVSILARLVSALGGQENECGNFYLEPAGSRDLGEEFIYTVYPKKGEPNGIAVDIHDCASDF